MGCDRSRSSGDAGRWWRVHRRRRGPSAPSSVVTIDPVRILDTRDPVNVGLPGPFVSPVSQKLTGHRFGGDHSWNGDGGARWGHRRVVERDSGRTDGGRVHLDSSRVTRRVRPRHRILNFSVNETAPNSVQVALPTTGANAGQDRHHLRRPRCRPVRQRTCLIDVMGYLVRRCRRPQHCRSCRAAGRNWGSRIAAHGRSVRSSGGLPAAGGTVRHARGAPAPDTCGLRHLPVTPLSRSSDESIFVSPTDAVSVQVTTIAPDGPYHDRSAFRTTSPNARVRDRSQRQRWTTLLDPDVRPVATFPGLWSDYIDATTTGAVAGSRSALPGSPCDVLRARGLSCDRRSTTVATSSSAALGRDRQGQASMARRG